MEKAFHTGSEKEIDVALQQLIQRCQSNVSPESDAQKAKSLLLAFLEKMLPAEATISSADDVHEMNQSIANAFKKVLFWECEKFASSQQQNPPLTENHEIHRLVKKLSPIFRYLDGKVAHLDDQLFDEACALFFQDKFEAASTTYQILLTSNTNTAVEAGGMLQLLAKAALATLDHAIATEAKETLNSWLGKTENRVLLMQEYAVMALNVKIKLLVASC